MARWWRHPVQAAQMLYGLVEDDLREHFDLETLRADLRDSWRLTVNSDYLPLLKRVDTDARWRDAGSPWADGPYVGATSAEYLEQRPVSERCCLAERQPDTHRRHVHDVLSEGGLAIRLPSEPPGCECGRPWPCAVARGSRFSAPPPVGAPPVEAGMAWLWPNGEPVRIAYTCPCGVTIEASGRADMEHAVKQHEESDEHR